MQMNGMLSLLLLFTVALAAAAREYDAQEFYGVQPAERGTIAIDGYSDPKEVKTLLVPSVPNQGKFIRLIPLSPNIEL